MTTVNSLLKPFQRFGVNLGLKRIEQLLTDLGNPHHRVPIVHVAGTNGKGSVCAYLSSVLTEAGYRVGRYTSPHLVDWTERITLNEQSIAEDALIAVLKEVIANASLAKDTPTQFEVITAAAWLYFAQSRVDVAVMEVGLGGRLDATNVCDRPLASIIVSLSKEHWQRLGPTVGKIAQEKAGVLKKDCPAIIGSLPHEAAVVVQAKITELNCPAIWVKPAVEIESQGDRRWARYQDIDYPLPLLGEMQLNNSAIAIATFQILQQQGWQINTQAIIEGMAKTQWQGRIQWSSWRGYKMLIDGAHNPAAAKFLRQYVDTLKQPVTWLMGMLSTKDHQDIFQALLRPGDRLYLVPVPDHSSAETQDLAQLALQVCPNLEKCQTETDLLTALKNITQETDNQEKLIVFCGSLYLIGYFFRHENDLKR
ncbi:FolC bifunctional protein [Hyella patelloides LEGE 07179]|uniref:tetrahydrofolate synthase n=1 Tax=Hyella patelloides LEGE 07179 TaxID=945734 RepID=A0A563VZR2_9CYAN|nr:folylpolyglutamate synthase/dihydrofolate synthase family protein [Hyella patelloides]VEP16753.1 FolC bifunctional protein [Hyella patelloides LEGE 07179]